MTLISQTYDSLNENCLFCGQSNEGLSDVGVTHYEKKFDTRVLLFI